MGPRSYLVVAHVVGRGRMTTTNFGCSTTCGKLFTVGRTLVFRARPAKGWRFVRWTGACRGRATCRVAVTAPRRVAATFTRVSA